MKVGFYYGHVRHTNFTAIEQEKCWSMLMNLNSEAEIYYVKGEPYDNRDETIAKRLGLNLRNVQQFLCWKSIEHTNKINERIKRESTDN